MWKTNKKSLAELRKAVSNDPGNVAFVDLARLLGEDPGLRAEAREICFRGLHHDPQSLLGRLTLAHLFYQDGLREFCVRELLELKRYSTAPSLMRLLAVLGESPDQSALPGAAKESEDAVGSDSAELDSGSDELVAELELDEDFLNAFDQLEDDSPEKVED